MFYPPPVTPAAPKPSKHASHNGSATQKTSIFNKKIWSNFFKILKPKSPEKADYRHLEQTIHRHDDSHAQLKNDMLTYQDSKIASDRP